jgi:hypothetical protein
MVNKETPRKTGSSKKKERVRERKKRDEQQIV